MNGPQNLGELLEERVAISPDTIFLFSEVDRRQYTFYEFNMAVNRAAHLLAARGVRKGDTVSLLMPNGVEYIVAYFACWKIGAVAGPVNSLLSAPEMAYIISNSEAKALLINSEFTRRIEDIRDQLPCLEIIIEFDAEAEVTKNFLETQPLLPSAAGAHIKRIASQDVAIIIYTSGTTGKPKGCLLTHHNLITNARQITNWMKFTAEDRLLTVMPLFHMNAVSVTTLTSLYGGASTIISPKFSASRFWQIISDYRATSFGSVATMLQMLLATYPEGIPEGFVTEQLRFAMCGSAPVPESVLRRFEEIFKCLVIEGYGLSESTCRSTFNPPDKRRRAGSCGLSIGNRMKIVDDDENEVGVGEHGEIVLRGENIFKGYYKNDAATAKAFRGGWFHTGDIAYRDPDGFYFIVDRKSEMIIRGGENIYPREIDDTLYKHGAVAIAAVVGVPDDLYGEEVIAFVVLKDGMMATEAELISFCRTQLAEYKCPTSVHFVADVPKGPTGKLLKRELVKLNLVKQT